VHLHEHMCLPQGTLEPLKTPPLGLLPTALKGPLRGEGGGGPVRKLYQAYGMALEGAYIQVSEP